MALPQKNKNKMSSYDLEAILPFTNGIVLFQNAFLTPHLYSFSTFHQDYWKYDHSFHPYQIE